MRKALDDTIGTHPRRGENHVDTRLAHGSSRRIRIASGIEDDRAAFVMFLGKLGGIVDERFAGLVPTLPAFVVYAEIRVAIVVPNDVVSVDDQDLAALHCLIHS